MNENKQQQTSGIKKVGNGRVPTRDDIRDVVMAAREAAASAAVAGEAAVEAAETALAALEHERPPAAGTQPPMNQPQVARPGQGAGNQAGQASRSDQRPQGQQAQRPGAGAAPTQGHRSMDAFEVLLEELKPVLERFRGTLDVSLRTSWVKVESRLNGHKLYLSKGVREVGRVESTLPPNAVRGATEPARYNGRIASWLPATVQAIQSALEVMASKDTPPIRGNRPRRGN